MQKVFKTFLIASVIIGLIFLGIFAWLNHFLFAGPKEPLLDPVCYETGVLRIELGERIFAFPRADIIYLHPIIPINNGRGISAKLQKAYCQKAGDPNLAVNEINIEITPKSCPEEVKNCNKRINLILNPDENRQNNEKRLIERLIKECQERNIFNTCRHRFSWNNLRIYFHYYLEAYPLEDIENTVRLIKQTLEQYEIKAEEAE